MLSHLRFHRRNPSNPPSPLPDQLSHQWETAALHEHPQSAQDVMPLPLPRPDTRPRSSSSKSNSNSTPPQLPPVQRISTLGALDLGTGDREWESDDREQERIEATLERERERNRERERQHVRDGRERDGWDVREEPQRPSSSRQAPQPHPQMQTQSAVGGASGFLGGVALQNYRKGLQQQGRPESSGNPISNMPLSPFSEPRPPPQPPSSKSAYNLSEPPPVPAKAIRSASSYSLPFPNDTQAQTGKRPAGLRLATEPALTLNSPPQPAYQPQPLQPDAQQRGKKGLPFLKNPMSTLLMRRRTSQNAPDIVPLPLPAPDPEPVYDPRIRGTRVHDFSAPRPPRRAVAQTSNEIVSAGSDERSTVSAVTQDPREAREPPFPFARKPVGEDKTSLRSFGGPAATQDGSEPASAVDEERQRPGSRASRMSYDLKPLPEQPLPPLPIKDDETSLQTSSSNASRGVSSVDAPSASTVARSSPSTKASFSRNVSVSGVSLKSSKSGRAKRMKSTSSRFSFDMIGAAKQEKLLEERHRQRELERVNSGEGDGGKGVGGGSRDSRFDDIDEFDYDAMMDDDGLEERIPGVNADYEEDDGFGGEDSILEGVEEGDEEEEEIPMVGVEEEEIPLSGVDEDNTPAREKEEISQRDEASFSDFRFQRSEPPSATADHFGSEALATPRDATGMVIGSAMTKDATPSLQRSNSPLAPTQLLPEPDLGESFAGLGIQGVDLDSSKPSASGTSADAAKPSVPSRHDDLYFDGGLVDELDFEDDGTRFDENLFDLDDTDQYGRPLPGVFAEAKSRNAAKQQTAKPQPESASTSRFSDHSTISRSTAHTSMSVEPKSTLEKVKEDEAVLVVSQEGMERRTSYQPSSMDDPRYHAILAANAQIAAASGKFRRDSSPEPPAGVMVTSPTTSGNSRPQSFPKEDVVGGDYEDMDEVAGGLDDYELDYDDDFTAEANASALANDSDGFYSQEFGFYSAPVGSSYHGHGHGAGHHPRSSNGSVATVKSAGSLTTPAKGGKQAPLSAENLYQYAHGGYFGPAGPDGVNRSASGRVVSREPNLTPITERSEYSNRNSIMSLALPPGGWGNFGDRHRDSGGSALASPGLAQLAMMADDDDLSLHALMKLRQKAFGKGNGSQISLASSGGSGGQGQGGNGKDGSPKSDSRVPSVLGMADGATSPWSATGNGSVSGYLGVNGGMAPPGTGQMGHGRKNSAFSVWSRDSDAGSGTGSPTLTMATPMLGGSGNGNTPSPIAMPGGNMNVVSSMAPPPPLLVQTSQLQHQQHLPYQQQGQRVQSPPPRAMSPQAIGSGCPPVFEEDDEDGDVVPEDFPTAPTGASSMSGSGLWMKSPTDYNARPTIYPQAHAHPTSFQGQGHMSAPQQAASSLAAAAGVAQQAVRRPGVKGHRHKGSADSISYIKEEEEGSGETRWVVERRRTAESGEVEVLAREVVGAGMI